jgi:hypothetical protein
LSAVVGPIVVAADVRSAPITGWDFEDGTLQGWTLASASSIGPTGYMAQAKWNATPSPTAWDPLGYNSYNPDYGYAAAPSPFEPQRSHAQDAPIVLRSPTFALHGGGQIIANLLGGIPQPDSSPPSNFSALSGPSIDTAAPSGSDTSYQGLALRRNSDGEYLLHKARTSNSSAYNGWQQMTFTEAELATVSMNNPGELFTLDLIDTAHGTFSSLNLDTISIPVPAGNSLVSGGGEWQILKRDGDPTEVTSLATALAYLGLDPNDPVINAAFQGTAQVINFHGSVANGHWGGDSPYLGGSGDRFAMRVTGKIYVVVPGDITFGFFSNDGAQLRIDGMLVAEDSFVGDLAGDNFGTINLSAGLHDVEFTMFETTGADTVELYVATSLGQFNSLNQANFELLEPTTIPEPGSIMLAIASMFAIGAGRRRFTAVAGDSTV